MEDSYDGRTGPDYDALIDRVAEACADPSPAAALELYPIAELTVPPALVSATAAA